MKENCPQRKHLAHNSTFLRGEVVSASPNPQAGGPPLSAVRNCLFNLFAATLHIGGRSSIRDLRTRHDVVTGTHDKLQNQLASQEGLCSME
jgi:hypothetical protein